MVEHDTNGTSKLLKWVECGLESPLSNEPPHTHLDEFFANWSEFDEEDYNYLLKLISLSSSDRYVVLVIDVAEDQASEDWWSLGFGDILAKAIDVGVPPALYLPAIKSAVGIIDYHCISKYRMLNLDRHGFEARLNVVKWESGDDTVDATLDFTRL